VKAAVLAASRGGDLAEAVGVPSKALVPVAGRPLISYVIDTLERAETIDEIVVVASPQELLPQEAVCSARQVHAAGETFSDSVSTAARLEGEGPMVMVTCDVPLLTPEAVDATVKFALDSGAELTYTMHDVDACEGRYPGTKRTAVRLREGRFTGGNIVVATRTAFLRVVPTLDIVFGRRKSVLGLAMVLGPAVLMRLALGALSVENVVARASRILECKVAVYDSPFTEIAFDVDKPSDLDAACAALEGTSP